MFLVEDGTGLPDATSYASEDEADEYFEDRNITTWTGSNKEAALIRATAALDALYRGQFPGDKLNGRDQSLEWPRIDALDGDGEEIADDEVPKEIKQATFELALRENITAGSTMPDQEKAIKRLQAGSVSIEYAANAGETTVFSLVDGILAGLLGGDVSNTMFGEVVR